NLGGDELRSVCATLHCYLRQAWQTVEPHEVTNSVDVGVLTDGEILVGGDTSSAVYLNACLLANEASQWGSSNASGPNLGGADQGVLRIVLHVLVGNGFFSDIRNHCVEAYIDAQLLQRALGFTSQTLAKWWQYLWSAIQEVDLRGGSREVGVDISQGAVC